MASRTSGSDAAARTEQVSCEGRLAICSFSTRLLRFRRIGIGGAGLSTMLGARIKVSARPWRNSLNQAEKMKIIPVPGPDHACSFEIAGSGSCISG
jgi:hypothetical protein